MTRKNIFSDLLPNDHDAVDSYKQNTDHDQMSKAEATHNKADLFSPKEQSAANLEKNEGSFTKVTIIPEAAKSNSQNSAPQTEPTDDIKSKEKPHYAGHRDRLRQRFLDGGAQAVADYEIVEMLLFLGIPRKDTKPLAKDLLKTFKSYPAMLAADMEDLLNVKGMTKNAAIALKLVEESARRMMQQQVIGQPVLNSWGRLMDYLYATMAQEKREHFRILFLDRKNNLIADEIQQTGTVDQTPVYPREIVKRALQLSSTALILVHNHPSGDPSPSDADITMTKQIVEAAKALDITVHDHVIVSKTGYKSFKSEGLL